VTSLLVRHGRVLDVEAGTYLEDHDVLAVDGGSPMSGVAWPRGKTRRSWKRAAPRLYRAWLTRTSM
jgi:hypothetical protein